MHCSILTSGVVQLSAGFLFFVGGGVLPINKTGKWLLCTLLGVLITFQFESLFFREMKCCRSNSGQPVYTSERWSSGNVHLSKTIRDFRTDGQKVDAQAWF